MTKSTLIGSPRAKVCEIFLEAANINLRKTKEAEIVVTNLCYAVSLTSTSTLHKAQSMSQPEWPRYKKPISLPVADILSFGVTIHELFTLIRPAAGSESLSCPYPLVALVNKMLSIEPRQRPTIDDVGKELAQAAQVMRSEKQILFAVGVGVIGLIVAAILKKS